VSLRSVFVIATAIYTIGPVPGSQPTHQPYALFRDGVVVPVAVPAEPSPWQWIVYPELAQQQQAERDAAIALNATVQRELTPCGTPIVLDVNCDGFIDSNDFFAWYTAFANSGGQP
jgi:hypothetical protein